MSADEQHRVLIVETDPAQAAELRGILSPSFDVTVSGTAGGALELLRSQSFHVVCSSESPSGMDAVTFMQRALSVPEPPCFLMLTSETAMRDQQLEGLSGVMMKPFKEDALVARVKRLSLVAQMRRRVDSVREAIEREREE